MVAVTDDMRKRIESHLDLVIQENEKTNITRITSREEALLLHIEDSLAGLPELEAAPSGRYADIGSGAGYPGIPLAIASGRETVLVESVQKKAAILESFIKQLSLGESVSVFPGRTEELAISDPESFSVISARALSQLPSLMELATPLLVLDGHLICYKAHVDTDELDHARALEPKLGMRIASQRSFTLSDDKTFRTIIVFEKVAHPTVDLPRRNGMAQKRPLKP